MQEQASVRTPRLWPGIRHCHGTWIPAMLAWSALPRPDLWIATESSRRKQAETAAGCLYRLKISAATTVDLIGSVAGSVQCTFAPVRTLISRHVLSRSALRPKRATRLPSINFTCCNLMWFSNTSLAHHATSHPQRLGRRGR